MMLQKRYHTAHVQIKRYIMYIIHCLRLSLHKMSEEHVHLKSFAIVTVRFLDAWCLSVKIGQETVYDRNLSNV